MGINYTGNLSGYECSLQAGEYPYQETTIKMTCNPYKEIGTGLPFLEYRRWGEVVTTEPFTLQGDTFTLTTDFWPYAGDPAEAEGLTCRITCNSGEGPKVVNFKAINQLTDCSTSLPDGYYKAEGELTVKITCTSRYEFEAAPVMVRNTVRVTSVADNAIARYTVPGMKAETSVGAVLEAEKVQYYPVDHNLRKTAASREYPFTKVSETEYSLTFTPLSGYDYTFTGIAYKRTPQSDKYGFVLPYRLTREEMLEAASKRWVEVTFDPEKYQGVNVLYVPNEQYIDTAKYVVSCFKLFCNLETTLKHPLQFGPYDMGMEVDLISDDYITLDFGEVQLSGKYGNSIDYEHTEIEVYLPFIGFTSISPAEFMDRTVKLQYQVNTLNGDALATLAADGQILFSQSCNVAMQIPFQLGGGEHQENSLEPNNNYLLETPPFIVVKTGKATDPGGAAPYRDTKFYAKLGDLHGYTQATEIDFVVLSDHITRPEIEEIISLLASGVFL